MPDNEFMKWNDAQETIRTQMAAQPRGYQTQLAEKLQKTAGYVNQIITGRRPIPMEHLDDILTSLNLEYDVILRDRSAADAE